MHVQARCRWKEGVEKSGDGSAASPSKVEDHRPTTQRRGDEGERGRESEREAEAIAKAGPRFPSLDAAGESGGASPQLLFGSASREKGKERQTNKQANEQTTKTSKSNIE